MKKTTAKIAQAGRPYTFDEGSIHQTPPTTVLRLEEIVQVVAEWSEGEKRPGGLIIAEP